MAQPTQLFRRIPASKNNQQLIDQLEEQSKLNKGGFSATGFDTNSSFSPMIASDVKVASPFDSYQPRTGTAQPIQSSTDYNSFINPTDQTTPVDFQDNQSSGQSIAKEFISLFNQATTPNDQQTKETISQQTGLPYSAFTTKDGGVVGSDSMVRYPDGTIRQYKGDNAYAVASLLDGSQQYSDGTIRKMASPSEFVTQENISFADGGMAGLVSGLFSGGTAITQDYGNYNPGMGYAGDTHSGTDFVPNDFNLKLPVAARVVQTTVDDGTTAYGNSVVLQLSTGEMLHFSHLASPVSFQDGEVINGGTVFGQVGSTGNSTGNHLDLEIYNAQGQIISPEQFSGFGENNPFTQEAIEGLKTSYQTIQQASQVPPTSPTQPEITGSVLGDQTTTQPTSTYTQQPQANNSVFDALNPMSSNVYNPLVQNTAKAMTGVADFIDEKNPTGTADFGVTETLRGNPEEGRAALSGTLERGTASLPTRNKFDLGLTELARGDVEGAGQVLKATGQNIADKTGDITQGIMGAVSDFFQAKSPTELAQNMLGKTAYAEGYTRPDISATGEEFRPAIGQSPVGATNSQGTVLGDSTQAHYSEGQTDTRDAFFKDGGAFNDYKSKGMIASNADQQFGGALNTASFNNNFFQREGANQDIKSVFGGTSQESSAMGKFNTWQEEQRRIAEEKRLAEERARNLAGQNTNQSISSASNANYSNASNTSSNNKPISFSNNKPTQTLSNTSLSQAASNFGAKSQPITMASVLGSPQSQQPAKQQSIFDKAKDLFRRIF